MKKESFYEAQSLQDKISSKKHLLESTSRLMADSVKDRFKLAQYPGVWADEIEIEVLEKDFMEMLKRYKKKLQTKIDLLEKEFAKL